MRETFILALATAVISAPISAQEIRKVDPNEIQMGPLIHKQLPPALLKRIKATTDTFEEIDGISYEQAVDLYKRDADPESNLIVFEAMASAYKSFCLNRCTSKQEEGDVYRALLLRSMFSEKDALSQLKLDVLSLDDARSAMKLYRLPSRPIPVYQSK
jgi:hypothetical protein